MNGLAAGFHKMANFHKPMAEKPATPAAASSSLAGSGRQKVLLEWDQNREEYPHGQCVYQWFEEQVERTPEAVAVVFGDQQLTYRELNGRANQLARHLQLLGIGPDVLVGICLERSLELLVAIFGVLKAGGAYVPLDPNYPPDRLGFMLEKTRAPVLIQSQALRAKFKAAPDIRVVLLDADWPAIARHGSANLPVGSTVGNLIYVIFTSGSTGQPKGAAVRHGGFSNLLHWYVTDFAIGEGDRALIFSSTSFDLTQKNLYATLLRGGTLYLYPPGPYDAAWITRLINEHRITLINCTPSAFYPLVEPVEENGFPSLATLRVVVLGGENISIARVRPWLSHPLCHAEIANTYGPTECTDICGFYRVTIKNLDQYGFIPLGRPINHVQIVIVDDALQPCPAGVPGELCIGGAGVGAGYVNDPEMTAAKFLPNRFATVAGTHVYRTGDRARMLPDGNIEFLGRLDHQVKIRGFRIELGEIEAALNTHPNIMGAVAITYQTPAGEPALAACLVARNRPAPAASELRGFLKSRLPDYMVPALFVALESFPLNPNGKVDRQALSMLVHPHAAPEPGFVLPRSAMEEQLAGIWSGVFGQKQIGISDNFFELGGHSLLAIRVINEIKKSLNLSLPLPVFFRNPTIEGIARSLEVVNSAGMDARLIPLHVGTTSEVIYFLDAGIGLCRLAQLVDSGPSSFATIAPLPPKALESAILDHTSGLPDLETLAAAHVAVIRQHQPAGECILAGHSFGGLLAFEVAHQLHRTGKKVKMILLLDSWAEFPPWWRRLKTLSLSRALASLKFRAGHLWWKIKRKTSRRMPAASSASHPEDAGMPFALEPVRPVREVPSEVPWEQLEKIYRHAMTRYRRRHLDSRAVLFRAQDSDQAHLYKIDDTLGWHGCFQQGFEMVEVSGDHFSLLLSPHVDRIADRIKRMLTPPAA